MKADQQLIRTVDVHNRSGNVVGTKDVVVYQPRPLLRSFGASECSALAKSAALM